MAPGHATLTQRIEVAVQSILQTEMPEDRMYGAFVDSVYPLARNFPTSSRLQSNARRFRGAGAQKAADRIMRLSHYEKKRKEYMKQYGHERFGTEAIGMESYVTRPHLDMKIDTEMLGIMTMIKRGKLEKLQELRDILLDLYPANDYRDLDSFSQLRADHDHWQKLTKQTLAEIYLAETFVAMDGKHIDHITRSLEERKRKATDAEAYEAAGLLTEAIDYLQELD